MKNFKNLLLLVLTFSAFSLSSCKSDDDGGGGGSATSGTIEAKVDGSTFTSLEMTSQATLASGNLIIQGNDADGKSIIIQIIGYSGEGTYNFDGSQTIIANIASYIEADISNPANSQTWSAPFDTTMVGSVSISSETDDKIEGTFEFIGQNSNDNSQKNITEGSFNLNKQTI